MEQQREPNLPHETTASLRVSNELASVDALLKTCYWFSRDFFCNVREDGPGYSLVSLKSRDSSPVQPEEIRDTFMNHALDFALRERVTAKTADIRDLLLAKAFSESGVLEDRPEGIFGDPLEEAKSDGMFKILGNR
jgi:His-Xaa-Ser system protein HxsD